MRAFGIHQRRAVVIQIFAIDVQRSSFVYGRQVGSVIHLTMSTVSGSPPKPARKSKTHDIQPTVSRKRPDCSLTELKLIS
jgi:hypothetical protein